MFKLLSFALAANQLASGFTLPKRQANSSLSDLFVAKGKDYVGVCADEGTLSDSANADIISSVFGQVTPENSMKWDATERMWLLLKIGFVIEKDFADYFTAEQGQFSFEASDVLVCEWKKLNDDARPNFNRLCAG